MAPAVVARLAADPKNLVLGGELRPATVLFCDLRNFTTITERMQPIDVGNFVNAYLTPLSQAVLDNDGTVGKYIGDAIMAFWNAPVEDKDHALHAVEAANGMIQALQFVEGSWSPYLKDGLRCGIGIASGPCVVGNFGSELRFEYSVMGDIVNTAARLETATKTYGLDILVTEATAKSCPALVWLDVDDIRLKGKSEPTRIFTPVSADDLTDLTLADFLDVHERLRAAVAVGDAAAANQLIDIALANVTARLTSLYHLYRSRLSQEAQPTIATGFAA